MTNINKLNARTFAGQVYEVKDTDAVYQEIIRDMSPSEKAHLGIFPEDRNAENDRRTRVYEREALAGRRRALRQL